MTRTTQSTGKPKRKARASKSEEPLRLVFRIRQYEGSGLCDAWMERRYGAALVGLTWSLVHAETAALLAEVARRRGIEVEIEKSPDKPVRDSIGRPTPGPLR